MAYIGVSPSNGVRRRFVYEATSNQTSFSGNDESGITLTYVDSLYLDVYQNGVKLKAGDDYTATTGTTVVLAVGATADDVVEMVSFDVFSVNDSVSASAGGSFGGNIGMGGTLAVTGIATFTDDIIIGDGKTIGSASDVDAMTISSGGVVTFSQAPVGAGYDLLLSDTISSAVAQYDISSTYINGTYDEYQLIFNLQPATDNVHLYARVFVGGTIQTGSIYAAEADWLGGTGAYDNNGAAFFRFNVGGVGGAGAEHTSGRIQLHNVNNTTFGFNYAGDTNQHNTSANHDSANVGGRLILANVANVVNGWRFYFSSGNITVGTIKLYGMRK